jgi:hypothetical protein
MVNNGGNGGRMSYNRGGGESNVCSPLSTTR